MLKKIVSLAPENSQDAFLLPGPSAAIHSEG